MGTSITTKPMRFTCRFSSILISKFLDFSLQFIIFSEYITHRPVIGPFRWIEFKLFWGKVMSLLPKWNKLFEAFGLTLPLNRLPQTISTSGVVCKISIISGTLL